MEERLFRDLVFEEIVCIEYVICIVLHLLLNEVSLPIDADSIVFLYFFS
jgi:hypothetical protein